MLITLEGIDGSGKTTLWEELQDGYEAVFTREPTESWYGEAVARSISDPEADPLAELFLYTADHAAHLSNTVCPALDAGEVVVSDRYSDSRYAYQGVSLKGAVKQPVKFVQEIHQPWTYPPDVTFYLDVDPETGATRSGANNKFEQAEYLTDVKANYETLIKNEPNRFVRIDATQPSEDVLNTVVSFLGQLVSEC